MTLSTFNNRHEPLSCYIIASGPLQTANLKHSIKLENVISYFKSISNRESPSSANRSSFVSFLDVSQSLMLSSRAKRLLHSLTNLRSLTFLYITLWPSRPTVWPWPGCVCFSPILCHGSIFVCV